jgi:hypothetical protein
MGPRRMPNSARTPVRLFHYNEQQKPTASATARGGPPNKRDLKGGGTSPEVDSNPRVHSYGLHAIRQVAVIPSPRRDRLRDW